MISVVVPILNEAENIPSLLAEIEAAAKSVPISEIIYIDDGSTDGSFALLQQLRKSHPSLRILRHARRCGQSAAMWTGVKAAGNDLIVTMDGDGQNDPADIMLLYETYTAQKSSYPKIMIAGERKKRNDTWVRRASSRFANRLRSSLLKDNTRDTGCSLKIFSRRDYMNLPYFDHMHRFLPALMIRDNVRILHVGVSHRPRLRGVSKYGTLDRAMVGISDLCGVWWLLKRAPAFPETFEDLSETI